MVGKIFVFTALSLFMFSFVAAQTMGSTDVTFFTGSGNYLCERTNSEAYWLNVSNNERTLIKNSTKSVSGLCNDTTFSTDFCCPKDSACVDGECVATKLEYLGDFCTALTNNQSCNTPPASFAVSTINSFGGSFVGVCGSGSSFIGFSPDGGITSCSKVTSCKCVWNNSKCATSVAQQMICSNGTITSLNTCLWSEEPDAKKNLCDTEGKIVVYYSAIGADLGSISCIAQTVEYPCSVSVQLPFFDKFSFIFAILVIACLYSLMRRESK